MENTMSNNNDDFLLIDADTADSAAEAAKGKRSTKKDPEIYFLPTIKNASKAYDALVRLMPRGVHGIKNKLHPTVPKHVHYIKDPELNLFVSIPCRKTLGESEFCSYCEKQKKAFFYFKDRHDEVMMKKWSGRQASKSHIGNFYIREDITVSANTGKVKLWEHTDPINRKLFEPTKKEDPNAVSGIRKKQRFNPYSPVKGRDWILEVRPSTKNPDWPDYDGSGWDEAPSDLAPSTEEIIALLDQCRDLQQFLDEVPSLEVINGMMQEYDAKIAEAEAQRGLSGTSSNFSNRSTTSSTSVATGNTNDFLGGAQAEQVPSTPRVAPATPKAPVVTKAEDVFNLNDDSSESSSDDEDDLPF